MNPNSDRTGGRFCWADLAAANLDAVADFYAELLGWTISTRRLQGGVLTVFASDRQDVASAYQLGKRHLAAGVPSHWTPYFSVCDVDKSAGRAEALGATVVVQPFSVHGMTRIALIQDPVGATFGLWEKPAADRRQE